MLIFLKYVLFFISFLSFFYLFILLFQIKNLSSKMNAIRENRKYEGWFTEKYGRSTDYSQVFKNELPLSTLINSFIEDDPLCRNEEYNKLYREKIKKDKMFLIALFFIFIVFPFLLHK